MKSFVGKVLVMDSDRFVYILNDNQYVILQDILLPANYVGTLHKLDIRLMNITDTFRQLGWIEISGNIPMDFWSLIEPYLEIPTPIDEFEPELVNLADFINGLKLKHNSEELTYGEVQEVKKTTDITPNYYGAKCKCGAKIDPYVVCDSYDGVQLSAHHHAIKKLLRAGQGHKSFTQDISEVIDTLVRLQEQLKV